MYQLKAGYVNKKELTEIFVILATDYLIRFRNQLILYLLEERRSEFII